MGGIGKRQGGVAMTGLMVWSVVGVMVAILGFKLLPPYLEFMTVKSVMDGVATDPDLALGGPVQLISNVRTRLDLNSVRGLPNDAFKVQQRDEGWDLVAAYEVRVHVLYNIDALLSFDHRARLSR